ncbi:MAG: hypothetical protein R2942_17255 [Ignavibacteria bacterium]
MVQQFEVTHDGKTETVIAEQHMHEGQTNNIPVRLKDSDHFTFMLSKISVASDLTARLCS